MTCETASAPAEIVETHSAVVILVGSKAYKMKKPVDLGFLDFSTLGLRKDACEREFALNSRMAPDVYLGTARVVNDDEEVLEHLVVMRRMPAGERLDHLLQNSSDGKGNELDGQLELIAEALVDFHDKHGIDTATAQHVARPEALMRLWVGCTSGVREWGAPTVSDATLAEVERLSTRFLDGRAALFAQRIAEGRIRDGHGDLQASDIFCLEDGPRLLDCLDFDDDLRIGDVVSDAAFLAMDLESLGQPQAASVVLERFLSLSAAPAGLVHFYQAYRAWVRCEVTSLRAGQEGQTPPASAARLAEQTLAHLNRARVRLICVGGLPGSGKSTIAAGLLAAEPAWIRLSSDITRRDQVTPEDDRYDELTRGKVYETMLAQARTQLFLGRTVVLDATWGSSAWRAAATAVAHETVADLVVLEVVCPTPVAQDRIRRRQQGGDSPSEADVDVLAELSSRWQGWPGATIVDTGDAQSDGLEVALEACR